MDKVVCNNCGFQGTEEDLLLVEFDSNDASESPTATEDPQGLINRILEEPMERDFLKGCPNCKTDSYLMDLN